MQAWVQGAIAKISNNTDGGTTTTPNPISGPSPFMPISINTGTFPGTPAVRLIGDCHFLHRLCQLLLFCLIFRRRHAVIKLTASAVSKVEDAQGIRSGHFDEGHPGKSIRLGSGNAGQGYTSEEENSCPATPLPASQVGSSNIIIRLHYIDGNYTVLPEMVEASLGPHMQNMPRPRGADAAGLLLRELGCTLPPKSGTGVTCLVGHGRILEIAVPWITLLSQNLPFQIPTYLNLMSLATTFLQANASGQGREGCRERCGIWFKDFGRAQDVSWHNGFSKGCRDRDMEDWSRRCMVQVYKMSAADLCIWSARFFLPHERTRSMVDRPMGSWMPNVRWDLGPCGVALRLCSPEKYT
ncbi:hypothetical protein HPP92_028521 [Vanilla planifolia]|uniref:Uncharacterized protein n=1 Tax=Vanilla planifolia TaxID=51239 RepID=A0A835U320_VANPL|nr:hypothetical protein HPP92_028521 [Vanilla planifolia]